MEVLTGRVVDSAARRVRRMRSGDGSGPRIRDDGAVACRRDIKQRAASAPPPRLMWWTLPDNIIELGCVAVHDDMQLR